METTQRPAPVTLLAVLAFVVGALSTLSSLSIVTGLAYAAATGNEVSGVLLYGLVLGFLSLAYLALGYGTWTLKPWALPLGIGVALSALALALTLLALGSDISRQLLLIVPAVTALVILLSPGVRRAFGRS